MNRLRRPASRGKETASEGETDGSAGGEVDSDAERQESASGGSARPGSAPAVPSTAGTGAAALPGMGAVAWPRGCAQPAAWAAARAFGPGTSMLPGGADAATRGGWPDWRSNIAVAALGPEDIVMSEDWRKKTPKAIKGDENEDNLSIMFEDLRNTGDDHWSASSGVPPTSGRGKRGRLNNNIKRKKPKTSIDRWFQEQMDKIVEMIQRVTAAFESIAKEEDKSGCSIQDVMALVKDCGAIPSTNEHFTATVVLTKRAEREMFMTLDTPEERFDCLKRKYEWMTRNDVAK